MISKAYLLEHAKKIGIKDLSIRTLSKAADVSVGTVYNYFPSKQALTAALLDDFWEASLAQDICRVKPNQGFVDYLTILFEKALMHTENFKEIMQAQLTFLETDSNTYYQHMESGLLKVLNLDKDIDFTIWNEDFTKEWFITFILENMMSQLTKEKPNFRAMEIMMNTILYKEINY